MELNNKIIVEFVTFVSITSVLCSVNFRISKWNKCPPKESKFQSLTEVSLVECVDECLKRKHCFAAGYKRLYTLCELFTEFQIESSYRGQCVIVARGDILKSDETENTDRGTECDSWEKWQSNVNGFSCVKQECQAPVILENEVRQGNLNDIGSKKIMSSTHCGCTQVQTQKCSSGGKWEVTKSKWDISPSEQTCSSVVGQMTNLCCSQIHIRIFTSQRSQQEANSACATHGGKLAKVDEEWKMDVIQGLIRDCPDLSSGEYWVDGYNKETEVYQWKFSDGTIVPMNKHFWKNDAPNDGAGVSRCFRMVRHIENDVGDYRFDDKTCSKNYRFICEQN